MHFGWRARDEHHHANLGDFEVTKEDGDDGKEYDEWVTERGSKTRSGEQDFVPDRAFNPKMFATGGPRCPVNIFKTYLSRRPYEMRSPQNPLHLAAIQRPVGEIWYKRQTLGKNSLGSFMKNMSAAAGITGGHTNHSVRRTMMSTLQHENTELLNIIGLAGQRNLKSLDSYSEASQLQQKEMSLTLSEHVLGRPDSDRKVLQPLSTVSGDSRAASMFAGATFSNCTFSFGSERKLQENPKKRCLSEFSLSTAVTRSCFFRRSERAELFDVVPSENLFFWVRSQLSSVLISSNHIKDRTLSCAWFVINDWITQKLEQREKAQGKKSYNKSLIR